MLSSEGHVNSVEAKGKIIKGHLKMSIGLMLDQNQTAIINNHRLEIQAYIMYIAKLAKKKHISLQRHNSLHQKTNPVILKQLQLLHL